MPAVARTVPWRDLVRLSRWETVVELCLPLPWLALSLWLSTTSYWPLALLASFVFFNAGLRLVHGAFHCTIGLSRKGCDAVMFALSALMLGSNHAVRHTHLAHHRHCLTDDDVEGSCARRSLIGALLYGPVFPIRVHGHALRHGAPAERAWIIAELLVSLAIVIAVFGATDSGGPVGIALRFHVCTMPIGHCLAAFFCVWTVHHDCPDEGAIARTVRDRVGSLLTFAKFYHVEHHLFPAVPTADLATLAKRIDAVAPDLTRLRVYERQPECDSLQNSAIS